MTIESIPEAVQIFVLDQIQSVEQMEVLLYLALHRTRSWTADELAKEFRSSPRSIARWLRHLKAQKLAAETAELQYIFQPETEDLKAKVEALHELYPLRRVTIIEMIFNKSAYRLQSFADAFKLREDDNRG